MVGIRSECGQEGLNIPKSFINGLSCQKKRLVQYSGLKQTREEKEPYGKTKIEKKFALIDSPTEKSHWLLTMGKYKQIIRPYLICSPFSRRHSGICPNGFDIKSLELEEFLFNLRKCNPLSCFEWSLMGIHHKPLVIFLTSRIQTPSSF